jgi:mono/diheme cytochrome c family protein
MALGAVIPPLLSDAVTRRPHFLLVALVVAAGLFLTACGGDSEPSGGGGEDSLGQIVYEDNCARCHGPDGEGGVGPQLGDGAVAENFPDIADQIAVIRDGRNGMPAWEGSLTPEEIEAVAMFEREELGR